MTSPLPIDIFICYSSTSYADDDFWVGALASRQSPSLLVDAIVVMLGSRIITCGCVYRMLFTSFLCESSG